ncbi:hypothetical protein G7K_6079-t1 [Saitoella complicata NRRL Y-17804]|uniref:Uncharacterized protein n=1 Tax=Saitoella complicata (strain BCRC 22490 / CBS 7301 / JCM 7358 / NBRC 10748 / NRRL Y-17804) TaxID=698492 RepID=A0A0E9NQP7_SAICN|nr:hypothetical protein G7K_6079-t1 [Saitoella complicata NRRL Y-17804]
MRAWSVRARPNPNPRFPLICRASFRNAPYKYDYAPSTVLQVLLAQPPNHTRHSCSSTTMSDITPPTPTPAEKERRPSMAGKFWRGLNDRIDDVAESYIGFLDSTGAAISTATNAFTGTYTLRNPSVAGPNGRKPSVSPQDIRKPSIVSYHGDPDTDSLDSDEPLKKPPSAPPVRRASVAPEDKGRSFSLFGRKETVVKGPATPPLMHQEKFMPVENDDRASLVSATSSDMDKKEPEDRPSEGLWVDAIRHEMMMEFIQSACENHGWTVANPLTGQMEPDRGVILRVGRGEWKCALPSTTGSTYHSMIAAMNVEVALTIDSKLVKKILQKLPQSSTDVPLLDGTKYQIIDTMSDLTRARKHQYSAFIRDEQILVVWADAADEILHRADEMEQRLLQLVWGAGRIENLLKGANGKTPVIEELDLEKGDEYYDEDGEYIPEVKRRVILINPICVSITLALIIMVLGAGWRQLAGEIVVDHSYVRLLLLILTPIEVFFTLFFMQVIVGCLLQIFGPIQQMNINSKYYSGIRPRRLKDVPLPHITIQCPVYKESLTTVIDPTVRSVKQAMSAYELQGGSCNLFYNDDGLQLISEEDRQARMEYYQDHGIGWVARPAHGKDGFLRRGRFKKASNMNFAMMISNKVEEVLEQVERPEGWSDVDEQKAYDDALRRVVDEDGRAWAAGDIRIGDLILIIDSDTRVPVDCLLDSASEMTQSPEIGVLQYASGVMQVSFDFFENGITFFTQLIYTAIRYTCANGDVAPFVGHNAVLRWEAIQQVSYMDEDGYPKIWSESHVSEDFDMSLRLQILGYTIRLGGYTGDGFQEGVSLTVYDELARWEKYAYGCNELLFHPLRLWFTKGPFTPLFRTFFFSNIRFTSKVTIISYIGTYYAIGAAWILTIANYFAIGWYNGYLDKWYVDSWKVWFSLVIVFNGLGNVALAIMRYRIGERTFLYAFYENFKWIFMLAIFLGGLSLHVSAALLSHMLEYNLQWGATGKEVTITNFWIELPKILKQFKYSFLFGLLSIITMCIMASPVIPYQWRITDFIAIVPLSTVISSHLLMPLVLNPAITSFSY